MTQYILSYDSTLDNIVLHVYQEESLARATAKGLAAHYDSDYAVHHPMVLAAHGVYGVNPSGYCCISVVKVVDGTPVDWEVFE